MWIWYVTVGIFGVTCRNSLILAYYLWLVWEKQTMSTASHIMLSQALFVCSVCRQSRIGATEQHIQAHCLFIVGQGWGQTGPSRLFCAGLAHQPYIQCHGLDELVLCKIRPLIYILHVCPELLLISFIFCSLGRLVTSLPRVTILGNTLSRKLCCLSITRILLLSSPP